MTTSYCECCDMRIILAGIPKMDRAYMKYYGLQLCRDCFTKRTVDYIYKKEIGISPRDRLRQKVIRLEQQWKKEFKIHQRDANIKVHKFLVMNIKNGSIFHIGEWFNDLLVIRNDKKTQIIKSIINLIIICEDMGGKYYLPHELIVYYLLNYYLIYNYLDPKTLRRINNLKS